MNTEHDGQITQTVSKIAEALDLAAGVWPALAPVFRTIRAFVLLEGQNLIAGLHDGSIVPDGQGGFVPVTNSRFDPKTGKFLKRTKP